MAEHLRGHFTDLVFHLRLRDGHEARLYLLLEHIRNPHQRVPLVALRGVTRALEEFDVGQPEGGPLPFVLAIVLHQADTPYRGPRAMRELFATRVDDALARGVPDLDILHIDLAEFDDATLLDLANTAAFPAIGLLLMKRIGDPDLHAWLRELRPLLGALLAKTPLQLVRSLLFYLFLAARDRAAVPALAEAIPMSEEYLTLAALLREEGAREGMRKGVRKGRKRGRKEGIEQGIAQGRRQDILRFLEARFGAVPQGVRDSLHRVDDTHALSDLVTAAALASDLDEFAAAMLR